MYFKLGVKERREDFFNFEREMEALVRELKRPETRMIVIRGVRRTGKSSLLRVGLADSGLPWLLLDARAFGPFAPDHIYDLLSDSLSRLAERYRTLKKVLGKVRGISISGIKVEFASRERPVLVNALEKLSEWGKSTGKKVVLALDEAQDFRFLPRFDGLLAHVYDYLDGIKLVLAGSEVGVLDQFLGRKKPRASLFGRPYFEIKMERLPRERAEEFLRAGFEQAGRKVGEEELSEAVGTFDGIVGWLTSYGYHALRAGHGEAMARTLQEGAAVVRGELESFLAQRSPARARYLFILGMLASPVSWSEVKRGLTARLGRVISDKQLSRYLAELVDYGFAVKLDDKYALADPMIKVAISGMGA